MTLKSLVRCAVAVSLIASAPPASTQSQPGKAKYGRFGIDLTAQKPTVKPGDDFWTYANGGWD